ncbi:unnamed protein product [Choristocarpus tenellus]
MVLGIKKEKGSQTPGVRRSGRQRMPPLKWWKGDHVVYEAEKEGVLAVAGIVKGQPTPVQSRKRGRTGVGAIGGGLGGSKRGRLEPLSPSKLTALPQGSYLRKEEACVVWDEDTAEHVKRQVVMRSDNLVQNQLEPTGHRVPGKDKAGSAAQAFSVPAEADISGWLSGTLQLPPTAVKDAEHVARSTQIYWVGDCQPNALELALAMPDNEVRNDFFDPSTAQRFLLSPGDHFYIPVNNIYRLENHSLEADALIYWTVLKVS